MKIILSFVDIICFVGLLNLFKLNDVFDRNFSDTIQIDRFLKAIFVTLRYKFFTSRIHKVNCLKITEFILLFYSVKRNTLMKHPLKGEKIK